MHRRKEISLKIYNKLFESIENKLKTDDANRLVIAIDGDCTSGKTTLANHISQTYSFNIIQMDSFFLPPELQSAERLSQPGGNIHYERFLDEVISKIASNQKIDYNIYDCGTMKYNSRKSVEESKNIVVEGTYSLNPMFGNYFNISVGLKIDEKTQFSRLEKRNPHNLDIFTSSWIPFEKKYFSFYSIFDQVEFLINTSKIHTK